jgi:hypothetical protein
MHSIPRDLQLFPLASHPSCVFESMIPVQNYSVRMRYWIRNYPFCNVIHSILFHSPLRSCSSSCDNIQHQTQLSIQLRRMNNTPVIEQIHPKRVTESQKNQLNKKFRLLVGWTKHGRAESRLPKFCPLQVLFGKFAIPRRRAGGMRKAKYTSTYTRAKFFTLKERSATAAAPRVKGT